MARVEAEAGERSRVEDFHHYRELRSERLEAAFARRMNGFLAGFPHIRAVMPASALNGGKKIRGTLLCLVSETLRGELDRALSSAVAVELIHAASLIHDDFVDQDRSRRRKPAVWTLTGARNAVLLGDFIFASAIEAMSAAGPEEGRLASRVIARMSGGALLEQGGSCMAAGKDAPRGPGPLYECIASLKTGALFGTACELGAVSARTGSQDRRRWFRYGARLGEAYQIADDMHDVKKLLAGGTLAPEAVAPLLPALLCFSREMGLRLRSLLREGVCGTDPRLEPLLRQAVVRMEREIEARLQAASAEVADLPESELVALSRRAPRDIIEMFTLEEGG